ncbi:PfkB family carbohydrate kinase [Microbacterium gorillae]|uniref:PfkB family carbohydrate kinase n=1 Tax=Microbacterium gorillae TaxID=1231063 RepID=UPI00059152BA|nr:PfkB family carbohydrate kinase [Microbacterium gorillae]
MTGRVVVIGDALIDEMRDEHGVREFVGGAALNVAVGLRVLGVPATLIAMVGDDEAGDRIRTVLTDAGVELIATPASLGSARAISERGPSGEPRYTFNPSAQGRRIRYGASERAAIAAAPLVVISCVALDDREQTADLLAALADAPPVLLDPNPRAGMMNDRAEFVRGFAAVSSRSALVKVGDDDAALLFGIPLADLTARLRADGVPAVLATAGAGGATVVAGGVDVREPVAVLPGPIIDTMGAGDATLASVAASLLAAPNPDQVEWSHALQRAMLVAAATCRHAGALLRVPKDGPELDHIGT